MINKKFWVINFISIIIINVCIKVVSNRYSVCKRLSCCDRSGDKSPQRGPTLASRRSVNLHAWTLPWRFRTARESKRERERRLSRWLLACLHTYHNRYTCTQYIYKHSGNRNATQRKVQWNDHRTQNRTE